MLSPWGWTGIKGSKHVGQCYTINVIKLYICRTIDIDVPDWVLKILCSILRYASWQYVVTLRVNMYVNRYRLFCPSNTKATHLFIYLGQFEVKVSVTDKDLRLREYKTGRV
jgi:hypothetical protein